MQGMAGDDAYFVDSSLDKVIEAAGQGTDNVNTSVSYQLAAGVAVETLRTTNPVGTGAMNLTGNEFANIITGNDGINVISGGAGRDVLSGRGGQDYFVFNTALNATTNLDTISGFVVADDTIRLENGIFTALTKLGTLAAAAFNIGAAATQADDRIIYNTANGVLIYDFER